jgi:hypothetical protein
VSLVSASLAIFPTLLGPKEMVKKEHISIPSIPGPQSRFDIDKARTLATNIGHDVPSLAPVIHKGSSRVRRSCCHFLIHSLTTFSRIFSVRGERDVWVNNIIQCIPSYTVLRGKVLLIFSRVLGQYLSLISGSSEVFLKPTSRSCWSR